MSAMVAAVSDAMSRPVFFVKWSKDGMPRAETVFSMRYGSAALPPEAMAAWGNFFWYCWRPGRCVSWPGAYEHEFIQTADLFSDFYRVFIIGPVKILGRVLWLTIDFLLIERTIINSLYRLVAVLINVFRRIHADSRIAWPLFILLGAGLAYGSYYLSQGNN